MSRVLALILKLLTFAISPASGYISTVFEVFCGAPKSIINIIVVRTSPVSYSFVIERKSTAVIIDCSLGASRAFRS